MKTYTPDFNYIMAENINRQVRIIKEMHAYYKAALLTEDEVTLRLLDISIAFEESFLQELYEIF